MYEKIHRNEQTETEREEANEYIAFEMELCQFDEKVFANVWCVYPETKNRFEFARNNSATHWM